MEKNIKVVVEDKYVPVVQLVRMLDSKPKGRMFESFSVRKIGGCGVVGNVLVCLTGV